MRSLGFFGDVVDYDANSFTLIPLFTARLLRTRQDCFKVSQVNDDVAALKSLHVAINQIACLVDVLLVNVAANRISDLLKQDLLSRLSGNAAKFFHRQGQEESIAQFHFLTRELPSLVYRKFGCLIGHFTNHHFCCRKLNARVWIPIDLNVLAGTKLLFRSRSNSFLHCVDYEIPLNALLLAERLDVLCDG